DENVGTPEAWPHRRTMHGQISDSGRRWSSGEDELLDLGVTFDGLPDVPCCGAFCGKVDHIDTPRLFLFVLNDRKGLETKLDRDEFQPRIIGRVAPRAGERVRVTRREHLDTSLLFFLVRPI